MEKSKRFRRKLTGVVVSDKNTKTLVVKVVRRLMHPKYAKFIHQSKKYHAHDEKSEGKLGDRVTIIESRPHSKLKKWELMQVHQ